jgi:RNA polymerase-binding transcription factor
MGYGARPYAKRDINVTMEALAEPLSPQEILGFKESLTKQLDDLLYQAEKTVYALIQDGTSSADVLDQATLGMGREYTLRIRDRESRLIQKIKAALIKIEDGSFGVCEECGEPISYARLKARPVTAYCIQCKSKMEAFERSSGL